MGTRPGNVALADISRVAAGGAHPLGPQLYASERGTSEDPTECDLSIMDL